MADEFSGFPREAFSFWKGLERNNNRDWFQAHKAQYEQSVRRPMQLLIDELAPLYGPGKLSRINRDMRFQKEKPYKDYLATGLGGCYISLSKEGLWVGTGMYKPDPAALRSIVPATEPGLLLGCGAGSARARSQRRRTRRSGSHR